LTFGVRSLALTAGSTGGFADYGRDLGRRRVNVSVPGVAALIANKFTVRPDETVCAVLCGGNIDANLLARVLEQVLVRKGRYIMLKVLVMDRPGMLAGLLESVADSGANVVEVFHRRAMWLAPLGRVGIEMLLEVRDADHGREVQKHLETAGYHVEPEGQDTWQE